MAEQARITREQLGTEALAEYERTNVQVAEVGVVAYLYNQIGLWNEDGRYETYDDEDNLIRVEYDGEGVGYSVAIAEAVAVLEKALELAAPAYFGLEYRDLTTEEVMALKGTMIAEAEAALAAGAGEEC